MLTSIEIMNTHYFHNISILLVMIGLCFMIVSVKISLKINETVSQATKQKWSVITGLMILFLLGYSSFLYLQFQSMDQYLELITGIVFLGGSLFVLIVMGVIQNTLLLMNTASRALENEMQEHKLLSNKLKQSQATMDSIFNSAIPLCITGKDFEIIQANKAFYDIFGHLTQSVDRPKCFESHPSDDCNGDSCPLTRILKGETEVVSDMIKHDINGQEKTFIVTARPFLNAQKEVIGIVETDEPDHVEALSAPDKITDYIAEHVVNFLLGEMHNGRIPKNFLPLQVGVGNVANGVLAALGDHPEIPPFNMYSEVFQDAMVDLMFDKKLLGASATSLTITSDNLKRIIDNIDFFAKRIVLRPQEISNHPGVIRRLGVIAMNTALEIDIYGNVNSSHLYGMDIVNGIGGSGEFTRNGYLSVFMTPSVAKGGRISAIVPMCPHVDNNEHSVQIVVTEQGLADLRGLGPMQRAEIIIEQCAHPAYRDYLREYIKDARPGHIRHDLSRCFELHRNLLEHGAMLPDLRIGDV